MPTGTPSYILIVRIISVLGMSFSLAIGLLALIGGWLLIATLSFVCFIPSLGLLLIVERKWAAQPNYNNPE